MSSLNDSAAIFRYHQAMIGIYGRNSSHALGWKDTNSQQVRFKALAGIGDLNNCSILDAGCGYGDLLPYLLELYHPITYTGIEQIPDLLDEATCRYGKFQNANFLAGNFTAMPLPSADYVFASGSLNYYSIDPDFIFKIIAKLYAACHRGLAFNLLSEIIPNGLIVAYDPEQIIRYCQSVCPRATLISDYEPDDFTIYMYRY
ncbi:class I SAM-dependent methyltransferase [Mucilaginibacter sp. BJC16-A38]|uniref:class I SAM-dependent methyltransferase n=1 Tax=Mucilaginibacter phenanthrenivorans TaxID=1234842 RepID=UPI002157F7BA|nr:class I SAM-dependent methyltransferase [Mucilaginibacter phenanthrenivorans]MCR8556615.1 class I SAM-dependent methyltransferase [Mucilaginibacter phenanthrenivorans]